MSTQPLAVQELRHEFLHKAETFFDAMFDPDRQEQLITFTQREDYVVRQGRELEAWLLNRHLQQDQLGGTKTPAEFCCPKCRKACAPDKAEHEAVPRELCSKVGRHKLHRRKYRCPSCKAVFFPLG